MFISTHCYKTGSFFHCDNKDNLKKIANNSCLISAALIIDSLALLIIFSIGLYALWGFSGPLNAIPLAVKVTMVTGSAFLFLINCAYGIYRVRMGKVELEKKLKKLEKENLELENEIEKELSDGIIHASECIAFLERSIEKLQKNLSVAQTAIEYVQSKSNRSDELNLKLEQALKIKQELEGTLEHRKDLLEYYRSKQMDYILTQEEVRALARH